MNRLLPVAVMALVVGCQEQLALPSRCPEQCPGSGLVIRDTIIEAIAGMDSTYTGYIGALEAPAMLVSNGLPAGDARGWVSFHSLPDSIFVGVSKFPYTIDSIEFRAALIARDTAVKGVQLVIHRIPLVDSTLTPDQMDQYLTAATALDSALIPDTLVSGLVRVRIAPEAWPQLLAFDQVDSTRFAVGFRINAPTPTGIRFGATRTGIGPSFVAFVQAPVTDTAQRRQTLTTPSDTSSYVIRDPTPVDPRNHLMGGKQGSRTLLRFRIPRTLLDSATIIRATLELTLAQPILGLNGDPATLQILTALVDVGAKSPGFGGISATRTLEAGQSGELAVEVLGPVSTWFGPNGLTTALLLGLAPEGGTFTRPEFLSTLASAGRPRLRLTYALSAKPGFP